MLQTQERVTNTNEPATGNTTVTNKANADTEERGDTIVDEKMDEAKTWITIVRKIRRYKAVINMKQLTTGTNHQKLKKVQEVISNVEAYMRAKIHMKKRPMSWLNSATKKQWMKHVRSL